MLSTIADLFFKTACIWTIINGIWVLSTGVPLTPLLTRVMIGDGIPAVIEAYKIEVLKSLRGETLDKDRKNEKAKRDYNN